MAEIRVKEESIKHAGVEYVKGIQTVDDKTARYFCSMGWAESTDGSIETGTRSTDAVVIDPDTLTQVQAQTEGG